MIKLYFSNDAILSWNTDDVCILRKKHRIVGSLLGYHPRTRKPHLPLSLMPEEAKLLIDKGIAQLCCLSTEAPDQSVIDSFYERREKLCAEQIVMNKENRAKEIQEKSNDAKAAVNAIEKLKDIPKEETVIQIFTESPWKKNDVEITMPSKYFSSPEDKLKYAVFKDLWEKKFFITNGCKFGGDFLVYAGDPFVCHSIYIVKCLLPSKTFTGQDIVTYGRLGHQVKKNVLLASFDDNQKVDYITLEYVPEPKETQKSVDKT